MKKLLLFCVSLFMIVSAAVAQSWAAPGATWFHTAMSLGREGYIKIEKAGDTIIQGKTCDILRKSYRMYNHMSQQLITDTLPSEYTYTSSNRVYYFRDNRFFTLYNFNAVPGDTWEIDSEICPAATDTVVVDSVDQVTINGAILKRLYTHTRNSQYSFMGPLVEKIGSLGYLFPEPVCIMDVGEGGPLRCYTDSSGWTHTTNIAPGCDYVASVGMNEQFRHSIRIYPNPSPGKFTLEVPVFDERALWIITSVMGREVVRLEASAGNIDAEILVPGAYLVSLYNDQGVRLGMQKLVVTGK